MDKIKDSIFKFLRLDNFIENLSGYFETRVELIKIEIREEIARVISHGLVIALLFLLSILFLLFFSVGLAHYLNLYFRDAYLGYWIVSGIYGLPCMLLFLFRKKINELLERYLISKTKQEEK